MQPKTEEFLNLLLWSCDKLMRPTFRNLTDSYEAWAYRNGFMRQIVELEKKQLIERASGLQDDRLYRLTEAGRLKILGGRDPETQWSRHWDGKWRVVLFDLPRNRQVQRDRLRRYLRAHGFGYLQGSVWVRPDPLRHERVVLAGGEIDVESFLLLEARPCAGESDGQIVAGAWDFGIINRHYRQYSNVLEQRPKEALHNNATAKALRLWAAEERAAWQAVSEFDPLLPKRLLPSDYLGCRTWQKRIEVLRQAANQLKTFVGQSG